jgi:hypothetical protein
MAVASVPVHFALTGAHIVRPARITFRVGSVRLPSALPQASRDSAVWLAFYNTRTQLWQPVPSTYDPATQTVTAQVRHLSWWAPWTWDWQGFSLGLRQLLSALGSGRAPAVSCPQVPRVTVTSAGGQDPPLVGCATAAGSDSLTVGLTDNRGVSQVASSVPSGATQNQPSYHSFYAYLATRQLTTRLLGGADIPPSETLTYSLPLHGPSAVFRAAPTVTSYAFDVIDAVGEVFAGKLNYEKVNAAYANCALNAVARSQPASLADVPGVAVKCMSALAQAIPALKFLSGTALKLILLDTRFILQDFDLAHDDIRGVSGQVYIARPAAVIASAPCTSAALESVLTAADAQLNLQLLLPENWVVKDSACQGGYAVAGLGGTGYPSEALYKQQGPSWMFVCVLSEFNSCSTEQNGSIVHVSKSLEPSPGLLQSLINQTEQGDQ